MSFFSGIKTFKKNLETPFETLNKIYISKEAILNNFDIFQKMNPSGKIFPVLKSNAYGHGIKEIATILKERKLDYIVVDSFYEALKVREVNPTPVLIIGYILGVNFKNIDFEKISLTVYDSETLNELAKIGRKVKIHLKIDTGMHRQGIYPDELDDFLDILKKSKNIELEGIFTHFADADSVDNSYSTEQEKEFKKALDKLKLVGFKPKYIHGDNSAGGVKNFCRTFANSMRLGIALYGVNPLEKNDSSYNSLDFLKLALSFESKIIQIKNLKKGEKVSYNGTFIAEKDMKIGIVPVGYYEALSRKLSNKFSFSYRNSYLKILGRVCMNLSVVDLTGIDINTGDEIKIISDLKENENNIYRMAEMSETIPYECLTRLSETVRRKIV